MIDDTKINGIEGIGFEFDQALFPLTKTDLKRLVEASIDIKAPFTVQQPVNPIKTKSPITGKEGEFKGQVLFIHSDDRELILGKARAIEHELMEIGDWEDELI